MKGGQIQVQRKCRKLPKEASSNVIASRGNDRCLSRKLGLRKAKKLVQGLITCFVRVETRRQELELRQEDRNSGLVPVVFSEQTSEGSDSLVKEYNWTGLGRPYHDVIEVSSRLTINGRLLEKEHKLVLVKQIPRSI